MTIIIGVDFDDLDNIHEFQADLGGGVVYRFPSSDKMTMLSFVRDIKARTGRKVVCDQTVYDLLSAIQAEYPDVNFRGLI